MTFRTVVAGIAVAIGVLVATPAKAQVSPIPNRDSTWDTVTTVTMLAGAGSQLLMPRIFYSDPEVTVGWKARWHVSVLAPVMTMTALAALNEYSLKGAFQGQRPGCDATNFGLQNCETYGMMSTQSFAGGAALGHGVAVFVVDTLKWSGGRVNGYALAGDVITPFVFGMITAIGRGVGNWETPGEVAVGGLVGLGFGFLSGMAYTLLQRPECGYTGNLICW